MYSTNTLHESRWQKSQGLNYNDLLLRHSVNTPRVTTPTETTLMRNGPADTCSRVTQGTRTFLLLWCCNFSAKFRKYSFKTYVCLVYRSTHYITLRNFSVFCVFSNQNMRLIYEYTKYTRNWHMTHKNRGTQITRHWQLAHNKNVSSALPILMYCIHSYTYGLYWN